ncbi:hypothetical protein FVE85_2780 [Porphyridium purpureum]|uniref:RING-type domain-containing protein n=1 Tax=Porphyridium purpureum TaxID=35688 RepID=A0A5J4YSW7_PORPP|nr:hypothetical protein FVE85_2780 [Porphyridium purpureum]|eukprot:POR9725..scf227_4
MFGVWNRRTLCLARGMSERRTCVVCLSSRRRFRFLKLLPCEHSNVCYDCITKLHTPCCPSCRTEVRLIVLNNGIERPIEAIEYEMRARDEQAHAATLQVVLVGEQGSGARSVLDLLVKELYCLDRNDPQVAQSHGFSLSERILGQDNARARAAHARPPQGSGIEHPLHSAELVNATGSAGRWRWKDASQRRKHDAGAGLHELEKAKIRARVPTSSNAAAVDQACREPAFEDLRVSELQGGGDMTTDSEMVVWGAHSRFSPNMSAHGVPIRLTLVNTVREPSHADVRGVMEDLVSLKPDVIVMCASFHDRTSFSGMVSWDRLIRTKHADIPRLWNLIQRPGFDALNAGGVDIRMDVPSAIQDIPDQPLRPKGGFFITAPHAHVFKLDLRKMVEAMLCHGSKRPGFINGVYKPRTLTDRLRGFMNTVIERSTEDPVTMDAAERMRTGTGP